MPVLLEINSGRETQKFGFYPEEAVNAARQAGRLAGLALKGLMTMGPARENPEELRSFFRTTRQLFEEIASLELPGVEMRYLSMGMSQSYLVAIEEGANLVRLGTAIFGPRNGKT